MKERRMLIKMNKKSIGFGLLVVSATLIGVVIMGGAGHTDNGYHGKIHTFFSKIKAGKVEEAVDFVYSDNPWLQKMPDQIQTIKNQLMSLDKLVGSYQSHEKLLEKVVADRYAYLYYFVAYDRQPLRFTFAYYKPKDRWMLFSFQFNTDITDQIAEEVKCEIFRESK